MGVSVQGNFQQKIHTANAVGSKYTVFAGRWFVCLLCSCYIWFDDVLGSCLSAEQTSPLERTQRDSQGQTKDRRLIHTVLVQLLGVKLYTDSAEPL